MKSIHKCLKAVFMAHLAIFPFTAPALAETEVESLTETPWQWVSFSGPAGQFDVETPGSYLLTFDDEGSLAILADCNNAQASYSGEKGALTIEVGPTTLALCPNPSRSERFLALLGGAARFFFEDGKLFIDLMADGGTLAFAPGAPELAAVEPEGDRLRAPLPRADIANDEGGPAMVTGDWAYTAAAVKTHYLEPVAALMDVSDRILGSHSRWAPRSGQIIGMLTRPLEPSPTSYEVRVPIQPAGASIDVDNDGEEETGIQIFATILGTNIAGDSFLEQIEQEGFMSYLADPLTGAIREGTFLVHAPDDAQGFPSSAGADGIFFTADDPAVGLPAGWTLVTLDKGGQVSFDRSRSVRMNILEPAANVSPDFSDQGILESYNSLIDILSRRYSYTGLRGLDWEQIRQEYLPRIEAADQANDFSAYYLAMNDLALSIRDAHVYVITTMSNHMAAMATQINERFGAGLGVQVKELSDGRFVVIYLDPEGPGAQAGWQFGTEIVSLDGLPTGERVETVPLVKSAGNPEIIRLNKIERLLSFPAGTETTIEYRQPGESAVQSVTLTAVEGAFARAPEPPVETSDISFKELDGNIHYIQWKQFRDPIYKIALWEKFLDRAQGSPGIIIDMRHNGGGATDLLYTMASYFFSAESPARAHWIDNYIYDEEVGDLVLEFTGDYMLSSPRPEFTFNGAVVVLVGEASASAAEYLPQFLQRHERAIVVGEHGTEGAGGYLESVKMPGNFTFYFTKGRSYFAGTEELNLEARGVTLDVRVPITEENEQAKQEGRDVVLEAAVVAVGEEANRLLAERLPGTTWKMTRLLFADSSINEQTDIENPDAYSLTFGQDGAMTVKADCNMVNATYELAEAGVISISPGPATLALCPDQGLGERFVQALGDIRTIKTDGELMYLSMESLEDQKYIVVELKID